MTAADAQSGTPYYKHEVNPWASDVQTELDTDTDDIEYYMARKLRILVAVLPNAFRPFAK